MNNVHNDTPIKSVMHKTNTKAHNDLLLPAVSEPPFQEFLSADPSNLLWWREWISDTIDKNRYKCHKIMHSRNEHLVDKYLGPNKETDGLSIFVFHFSQWGMEIDRCIHTGGFSFCLVNRLCKTLYLTSSFPIQFKIMISKIDKNRIEDKENIQVSHTLNQIGLVSCPFQQEQLFQQVFYSPSSSSQQTGSTPSYYFQL